MRISSARIAVFLILTVGLVFAPMRSARSDVILQLFEARWETIERRMPDVFMAGYDALWIPPPGKADSGGFSVGYDVFDRFNFGNPFDQTLYGTEPALRRMIEEANRSGVLVYPDLVLNHNGFRDINTPGFVDAGDYPGFVVTLPSDIDGDFHGAFEGGVLNERLAGLIDIAQEKNHQFIRHPVETGDPNNIPNEQPRFENRRFYPDTNFTDPPELGDTSGDRHTPSGFNLDNPEAGDPVIENATGLLTRHTQYMVEVIGADGFRLDAVKHTPQWFFNDFYDPAVFGIGEGGTTPFSFGEALDGSFGLLDSYTRKDGFGNRDVLDFPLFFTMRDLFNAGGFGDMRSLEFASFDGSDGNANDGTRGVMFVSSHDDGPPANDNLGYAHILTRPGFPIVYMNAKEFGDGRDFPRNGRGDALGGQFGDTIVNLVDIHQENGRGAHRTRFIDGDVYIYERSNAMVVGLNDNESFAADRDIFGLDFRNVTLVELTGNPGADPTITIDGSGNASNVTIPAGSFAVWGLQKPRGSQSATPFEISPVSQILPPDPETVPNGLRRLTPIEVVSQANAALTLRVEPEGLDDSAVVRIDNGAQDVLNPPTGIFGSGEFAEFQPFNSASPSAGGGTGIYTADLDLSLLNDGTHYIEAVAFLERTPSTLPTIFETFRKVIHVDLQAPEMTLRFPTQTGSADVQSTQFEIVVDNPDATAETVHVLIDFAGTDAEAIAAAAPENRANKVDRTEFRFNWTNITPGLHSLTVVAIEPTGTTSVTQFGNIDASVPLPNAFFVNLPDTINTSAFNDIEIWVDTAKPGGGSFSFDPDGPGPDTFDVQLTVDGEVFEALPFDSSLIGSENTLFQNDMNLGDEFDVFRFNWRGYGTGFHTFEARAELNDMSEPPSIVARSVQVPNDTAGPDFTIASPAPPLPGDPPTALLIAPSTLSATINNLEPTARSVTAFYQAGEAEALLASQTVDGSQSSVTLTSAPGAVQFFNGVGTIRVAASTNENFNEGIAREKSTQVLILGATDFAPPPQQIVVDGQDNDWTGTPPTQVHAAVVSGTEWIYAGEPGDARTDLGDDTDIGNTNDAGDFNMDLTELRVSASADDLFFLARFRDIDAVNRPSFALAIDTGETGDSLSVNFIGDESQTELDLTANTWDFTTQVHFTTDSFSRVEVFDDAGDPVWFSPEGEASFVSAENDLIEFSIPRAALGLTDAAARTISIQGATFENQLFDLGGPERVAWNNDVDSTREIAGSPDALDVVGGEVGVSANAFGRAFADGNNILDNPDPNVRLIFDIDIPAPADSGSAPPPAIASVAPGNATVLGSTDPVTAQVETGTIADSVIVAVNGEIALATLSGEAGGVRTWQATTAPLALGANGVAVAAFGNSNLTGQSDSQELTWQVEVPISSNEVIDHVLEVSLLTGDKLAAADVNADGAVDVADAIQLILEGK